jgi:hypothetical protein
MTVDVTDDGDVYDNSYFMKLVIIVYKYQKQVSHCEIVEKSYRESLQHPIIPVVYNTPPMTTG